MKTLAAIGLLFVGFLLMFFNRKAPEVIQVPEVLEASQSPVKTLPPEVLNAIVTISGIDRTGTGFVCNFKGKPLIATNQHLLAIGENFTIRTNRGDLLVPKTLYAAGDADLALIQCVSIPAGIIPLEIASLPGESIQASEPVIIPGNNKGDGVITQSQGKILAAGPQRIEIDNRLLPGSGGGPIVQISTNKVLGVLTEDERVTLGEFQKGSFVSKNLTTKPTAKYFGQPFDSAQRWEPLNWVDFQQTELVLKKSREELDDISCCFSDTSPSYKSFKELHMARLRAREVVNGGKYSPADKKDAVDRFFREIDVFSKLAASRLSPRKIYYSQQKRADAIFKLSNAIVERTAIVGRDKDLAIALLQRGE